jgi:hypothetical protein
MQIGQYQNQKMAWQYPSLPYRAADATMQFTGKLHATLATNTTCSPLPLQVAFICDGRDGVLSGMCYSFCFFFITSHGCIPFIVVIVTV